MAGDDNSIPGWIDHILDGIDDLFPGNHSDPLLSCIHEVARQFERGTPEYQAAIVKCAPPGGLGGGGSGNVANDIKRDIGDFLDTLLGGVQGDLDDVIGNLGNLLEDAIGGLGRAGVDTTRHIGDIAGAIIGQTGQASQGAINVIGLTASGAIDTATGVITDMTGSVLDGIEDFLKKIREAIEQAVRAMGKAISDSMNAAVQTLNRVVTNVLEQVSSVVSNAVDAMTSMLRSVIDGVQDLIAGAVNRITEVADRVFQAVTDTVTNIRDTLAAAFDNITRFIGDSIEKAGEFINEATSTLQTIGQEIVQGAENVYGAITDGVHSAISELTDAASGALSLVREGLDNLQAAVTQALDGIGPVLTNALASSPQGIAASAVSTLFAGAQSAIGITLETPEEDLTQILRSIGVSEEAIKRVITMARPIFTDSPGLRGLFLILISVFIALAFAQQIANAAGIKALQDVQPGFAVAVPAPEQVADMVHYGLMSDQEARSANQKAGYSEQDAERLLLIGERTPEIGIIQTFFLRGFVDRDTASAMLGKLGLTPGDRQRILDMAFFIPPVSDLITMSVREVFSPDIAEKFGQFQDFPAEFPKFAAQQGISEEWARNYWAAHWALPSVQMGFEMLHRGVIDQATLELLLRAQDVMPFWRDKLIAISYNPLTRVDVRRMHKLGVLDDNAVKKAYKDIGYNDTNAELLLQFTKELNKPAEGATPEQLDELTRSAITGLYAAGTLSRQDAFELLQAIGIGSAAAVIFLDMVDLRSEAQQREAKTQLILDQAKAGIIRFSEAQSKLETLGLEPLEVQRALVKLQQAQDAQNKLPSPQQLDDLLAAGLIPRAVYLDTMLRLGYSAFWAERLSELATMPTAKKG
jgi:phage-related protein